MSELTTVARPYARAVFEMASGQDKLAQWADKLSLFAAVASDEEVSKLLDNPTLTRARQAEIFCEIANIELGDDAEKDDALDTQGVNLINLMAENGKLSAVKEVSTLYSEYRAEAESTIKARLVSAYAVNAAQKSSLAAALKRRLGCKVELTVELDKSLIGGAIVYAGDLVIDGSLRGQLNAMAASLNH